MRPAVFIAMLFFILAVVATAIMMAFGWAVLSANSAESCPVEGYTAVPYSSDPESNEAGEWPQTSRLIH